MSSLIQAPFVRKSYPSLGNPAFVDDIVAANQQSLDLILGILGVPNPNFCILTGFGIIDANTYGGGFFMLNGKLYFMPNSVSVGSYLTPAPQDILSQPFSDTNARNIYTEQFAVLTSDPTGGGNGATPQFVSGGMYDYRFDLTTIKATVISIQNVLSQLGGAAFLNVGTTPNHVAAGDDPRFGYTEDEINTLFSLKTAVLLQGNPGGNQTGFVPSVPYDPATKLYVDNQSAKILLRSSSPVVVGDVPTGGVTIGVSFGSTLASTSYMPIIVLYSNGDPHNDTTVTYTYPASGKLTTGFTVRFQEWNAQTQNLSFDWFVLSY